MLKYGTFNQNYQFFYNFAKEHSEYEFILKPHPELKRQIVNQKLMPIKEMEKYFNDWQNLPNAQIYELSDYFDMFRTSDLLITDCNSFLLEYLPTNKPVIHLINDKSVGHNKYGQKIISGYYKVINVDEIEQLLKQLLVEKQDPLKSVREKIINDLEQSKDGVAKQIIQEIEQIFEINYDR